MYLKALQVKDRVGRRRSRQLRLSGDEGFNVLTPKSRVGRFRGLKKRLGSPNILAVHFQTRYYIIPFSPQSFAIKL